MGADPTLLELALIHRIGADGALRFDDVMASLLYDEHHGFYATGGRAGAARGDFITSPEVGPLFGAVIAGVVDGWWTEAGRPQAFTVVEHGAGPGTLGAAVRRAKPACAEALSWVMVERTESQRRRHVERLGAVALDDVEGGLTPTDPYGGSVTAERRGVQLLTASTWPPGRGADAIVANELLDNLPTRVVRRTGMRWDELWVGVNGGRLAEEFRPLDDPQALDVLDAVGDGVDEGAHVPLASAAMAWLGEALEVVGSTGHVLVLDYGATTPELAERGPDGWLRTYAAHGRGGRPLDHCGEQDVTCDVPVDQLALVAPPVRLADQAAFLVESGIDVLVDEGRRLWTERAHLADLEAIAARSRVHEAEALLDPDGLGAHVVLEWTGVDSPVGVDARR